VSGLFKSLKTKATDDDWMGGPRAAATSATTAAQQAAPVADAPAQPAGSDVVDQIQKLDELRDLGLLSAAEFEQKKAEPLARM
jgi:Short C-terminal domain